MEYSVMEFSRIDEQFETFNPFSELDFAPSSPTFGMPEEYAGGICFQNDLIEDPLNLLNPENFDITTFLTSEDQSEYSEIEPIESQPIDSQPIGSQPSDSQQICSETIDSQQISSEAIDSQAIESQSFSVRKPRAGVKKIDLEAKRYILEEDVDVETISNNNDDISPILEAGDVTSLLNQFEALDTFDFIGSDAKLFDYDFLSESPLYKNLEFNNNNNNCINVNEGCTYESDRDVEIEDDLNEFSESITNGNINGAIDIRKTILLEPKKDSTKVEEQQKDEPVFTQNKEYEQRKESSSKPTKMDHRKEPQVPRRKIGRQSLPKAKDRAVRYSKKAERSIPISTKRGPPPNFFKAPEVPKIRDATTSSTPPAPTKPKKQAIDIPSKDLINRIKQSSKRKPISIIDPVPTKKRHIQRESATCTVTSQSVDLKATQNGGDVEAARHSDVIATRPVDFRAARPANLIAARPANVLATRPKESSTARTKESKDAEARDLKDAQTSENLKNVTLDHDYCNTRKVAASGSAKGRQLVNVQSMEKKMVLQKVTVTQPMGKPQTDTQPMYKKIVEAHMMRNQPNDVESIGKRLTNGQPVGQQRVDDQPVYVNAEGARMVSVLRPVTQQRVDDSSMDDQPVYVNAEGTRMVSVLRKMNRMKKRLNLEEYKKRRRGLQETLTGTDTSTDTGSTSQSASQKEDEETRLLRHQEKMRRMTVELLNTAPKAAKKEPEVPMVILPPKPVELPPNLIMRTTVSVAVDTRDLEMANDPIAANEQLASIRPLLQKSKIKIDRNSLIACVIEKLPKLGEPRDPPRRPSDDVHGENLVVSYLEKSRVPPQTSSVACQTDKEMEPVEDALLSIVEDQRRAAQSYNRRVSESSYTDSSDSSSSDSDSDTPTPRYDSRRKTRRNSISSYSSSRSRSPYSRVSSSRYSSPRYSGSSSFRNSRSRSRSLSPRTIREREKHRAVVERRVVYVGEIPPGTTRDYLRKRFRRFGRITDISIHTKKNNSNNVYGFVTYEDISDALKAIDHGNDYPGPKFKLSFGGRRVFCETNYADLDNMQEQQYYGYQEPYPVRTEESFEDLLRQATEMRYLRDLRNMRQNNA